MAIRKAINPFAPVVRTFAGVSAIVNPLTSTDHARAVSVATPPKTYVEEGKLDGWQFIATMNLIEGLHTVALGGAGGGKDVFLDAYAKAFNKPIAKFAFKEGVNPQGWVSRETLKPDNKGGVESVKVMGDLTLACQGLEKDGVRYPYVILFSDFDRAEPAQVEFLRQALQLGGDAYLTCPIDGRRYPILDGTTFYFTANSGVDGDGRRGMLVKEKDASIINRLLAVNVPPANESFEVKVVMGEYPELDPNHAKLLVKTLRAVRKASIESDLGFEVSIRQGLALGKWALAFQKRVPSATWQECLKRAYTTVIMGHFMNKESIAPLWGALDPLLGVDSVILNDSDSDA
jgi:hypothetical protein